MFEHERPLVDGGTFLIDDGVRRAAVPVFYRIIAGRDQLDEGGQVGRAPVVVQKFAAVNRCLIRIVRDHVEIFGAVTRHEGMEVDHVEKVVVEVAVIVSPRLDRLRRLDGVEEGTVCNAAAGRRVLHERPVRVFGGGDKARPETVLNDVQPLRRPLFVPRIAESAGEQEVEIFLFVIDDFGREEIDVRPGIRDIRIEDHPADALPVFEILAAPGAQPLHGEVVVAGGVQVIIAVFGAVFIVYVQNEGIGAEQVEVVAVEELFVILLPAVGARLGGGIGGSLLLLRLRELVVICQRGKRRLARAAREQHRREGGRRDADQQLFKFHVFLPFLFSPPGRAFLPVLSRP